MIRMLTTVRAFVAATFRILISDPTTLFFTVVLPIGIITIIGTSYGGVGVGEVAVIGGEGSMVAEQLAAELDAGEGIEVVDDLTEDEARRAIRRFDVGLAVLLPDDPDATLARGETLELRYLGNEADTGRFAAVGIVQGVLDNLTAETAAARALADGTEVSLSDALAAIESVSEGSGAITAERVTVGDSGFADASPFSLTAAQNLVLFTFITCLTTANLMVHSRQQGIIGRAMVSPAGPAAIAIGLAATWFLMALTQSALIVIVGAVVFDVDWGDPLAAATLLVLFSAVGAGAGLLAGAVFGSEERLGAAGAPIGLVLGALGGCMVPAEFFPDSIRTVAKAVPHFWAMEAWQTVLFDGGGLADIAGAVGSLATFAAAFAGIGAYALHRSITSTGH